MNSDAQPSARSRIHVVVPAGGRFEGLLAFRNEARIEGEVFGRVTGTGRLEVGAGGSVTGLIQVDELVSRGRIEGDVDIRARVELDEGATLSGTLRTARLAVADGATIQGRCDVG